MVLLSYLVSLSGPSSPPSWPSNLSPGPLKRTKERSRTLRLFLYFSNVLLCPQEALIGTPGQWELLRGFANELRNSIQAPVLMVKRGCRVLLGTGRGEPSLHAIPFFLETICALQAPPALVSLSRVLSFLWAHNSLPLHTSTESWRLQTDPGPGPEPLNRYSAPAAAPWRSCSQEQCHSLFF